MKQGPAVNGLQFPRLCFTRGLADKSENEQRMDKLHICLAKDKQSVPGTMIFFQPHPHQKRN